MSPFKATLAHLTPEEKIARHREKNRLHYHLHRDVLLKKRREQDALMRAEKLVRKIENESYTAKYMSGQVWADGDE